MVMFTEFLQHSEIIDWRHESIGRLSAEIRESSADKEQYAENAFHWVRDMIRHSWDHRQGPVTCIASEVLRYRTGFCYAKSHLLAALLRAGGIPSGFCYQRLRLEENGSRYCLHGLNGVYLQEYGWYRIDPRGNKNGVDARFCPPVEALAFSTDGALEQDLPGILPEPLEGVIKALTEHKTIEELYANLPDIDISNIQI